MAIKMEKDRRDRELAPKLENPSDIHTNIISQGRIARNLGDSWLKIAPPPPGRGH